MARKLSISSLILFILIGGDVLFGGLLTKIDYKIFPMILEYHIPILDKIMLIITILGNIASMVIFTTIITLILLFRREYLLVKFFLASMLGSSALMSGLKEIIGRDRPQNYIGDIFQQGNSFPSGHASSSMALSLGLFFIIYSKLDNNRIWQRNLIFIILSLFTISIATSRVYFGVHYLSDVIGGATLSIFWVSLMVSLFQIDRVGD